MIKTKLPDSFKLYFWDVNFSSLCLQDNPHFIVKRILDRGNTKALKWVLANCSEEIIKETVMKSKDMSPKTANFWADVYNLDRTKVLCLQKPYARIPFGLSS